MHVPAHYITHVGSLLQEMGVNPFHWLDACDASHGLLCDNALWIPRQQYELLMTEAVLRAPQPDIGLQLGKRLGIGSHGLLGYGLLRCTDLAEAAQLLDKYLVTRTPFIETAVSEHSDAFHIQIGSSFSDSLVHRSFCETVTVSLANLFTMVAGQSQMDTIIQGVQFDFDAPQYQDSYAQFLQVECRFSQPECTLLLEKDWLHHHFSQADEEALQELTQQFEQQLLLIQGNQNKTATVQVRAMLQQENQRIPTLDDVARMLAITPRTLHRKLIKEGTRYRTLLADFKKQQAIKYLKQSNMSVEQVSWALGYDDVANFRRAFKSWMNMTPIEFRNK